MTDAGAMAVIASAAAVVAAVYLVMKATLAWQGRQNRHELEALESRQAHERAMKRGAP